MTETEKRRSILLDQTRKIYSDKNMPPAIHPRYTGAYKSIYKNEFNTVKKKRKSSFGIRFIIAFFLFCLFSLIHSEENRISKKVVAQIQQELSSFIDLNYFH